MLVLTRRLNESIIIGGDIKVKIVTIKGNQVALGIIAPPNVAVHRQEIQEKINRENKQHEANPRRANLKIKPRR